VELKRAIEILNSSIKGYVSPVEPPYTEAKQLAIEALQRTASRREQLSWKLEPLLRGDTIE